VGGSDGFTIRATDSAEGPVTVSIRPEDFEFADDGPIVGKVTERYFQGDQTNYVIDPDASGVEDLTVVIQGRESPIDTGETVRLTVPEEAPVVFS
ncbi:MAG: TOBE domain-containing protein, partial [Halodesulfurarchaeum sp.]